GSDRLAIDGAGRQGLRHLLAQGARRARRHACDGAGLGRSHNRGAVAAGWTRGGNPDLSRRGGAEARGGGRVGGRGRGRVVEAGGAAAATAGAVSAMAEVFGKEVRTAFLRAASTRWGLDPFARGAWVEGPTPPRAALAAPHHERVLFAGEATDPQGGVAGAN